MDTYSATKVCPHCQQTLPRDATVCAHCGYAFSPDPFAPYPRQPGLYGQSAMNKGEVSSKKLTAGVLAILFGSLGIHKFILGYKGTGLIMLLVTLLTCGLGASVMGVIALVEGIIYLTKSDEEFYSLYILNKKEWF